MKKPIRFGHVEKQRKLLRKRLIELQDDTIGGTGHLPPDEIESVRRYNRRTVRALRRLILEASPNALWSAYRRLGKDEE